MLIVINKNKAQIDCDKIYNLSSNETLFLFKSPNHHNEIIDAVNHKANPIDYSNVFINDSFLFKNDSTNRIIFCRDWPGNVQVFFYYSMDNNTMIISDSINKITNKLNDINLSSKGMNLFINERKHFHSYTIYKDIHMLHPGLYIDLCLSSIEFDINPWYFPFRDISVKKFSLGRDKYIESIDNSIKRLVNKDDRIALMFSGGSDSSFILWRIKMLGYKKIDLFTICIDGQNIINDFAKNNAELFNLKINLIKISSNNIFQDWKNLFSVCYHYLSDMRINGMFATSVQTYTYLKNYYKGRKATIVWASQYALISPTITTKAIFFKIYPIIILSYIGKLFRFLKPLINRLCLKLIRSHMLNNMFMHIKSKLAFEDLYKKSFNLIKSPDQLINLFLSTDYNHLKHWWMDWRNKVSKTYYPNSKNVYPFHDRTFQESTMEYSLSLRIGSWINIFKMPYSYKEFFYKLFPNYITSKQLKKGNLKSLPEWKSLYKNKSFYDNLLLEINEFEHQDVVKKLCKLTNISIPKSYKEFSMLKSEEIEKISGIMFIVIRYKMDNNLI